MHNRWNLIFKQLCNFYSKKKSHTYKPWMRSNLSSIRREFWRSGMAEVKGGHSSLWRICCLVPQKGLCLLVQCRSSETAVTYKIHELLPIRNDHLCRKMPSQEAGGHCLRHSSLEKMSPSLPHTLCYLQRSTHAAELFNLVPGKKLRSCSDCSQQRGDSCLPVVLSVNPNTYKGSAFQWHSFLFLISVYKCVYMHTHTCTKSSQSKRNEGNLCMHKSCRNIFSKVLIIISSVFVTVIRRGLILKNRVHSSSF